MAGREGTRFGPYLLTRRLGGGASGEVYLAEGGPAAPSASSSVSGQVAVKVLNGSSADPTTREIARQAETAGGLRQPHIIPFYGIVSQDGALGVAMAFAPGGSLGDALAGRGADGAPKITLPLAAPVTARVIGQIARALDAAHAAGLVHADLKPNNVFIRTSPSGSPLAVVSDFGQGAVTQMAAGVAAQSESDDPRNQPLADAQLLFAAPEQVRGEQPRPASDRYALAALAYFLLVGEPTFSGAGSALINAIASQAVVAPSRRRPEVSPVVDTTLLRALAKDPAQRFPSAGAFAEALEDALAVPAGASSSRGVTAGMAQLSDSHPAMRGPARGASSPGIGGSRSLPKAAPPGGSGAAFSSVGTDFTIPQEDASPSVNRRLAIIAGSAMLLVVLSCVLILIAFTGGTILPQIHLGGGPSTTNVASTPKANATATAVASNAQDRLRSATTGQPRFTDGLTSNAHSWQTSANTLTFSKDGYHLFNHTAGDALSVNAPGTLPSYATMAVRSDVIIAKGSPNGFAGVQAFVTPEGDLYAFVVSTEGKYQAWQRVGGSWTLLLDGFVSSYHLGFGQKNTVEVLADSRNGASPQAWFFVNGQFVNTVALDPQGPSSGGAGLIVKDSGVEAVYTNFAVYGSDG